MNKGENVVPFSSSSIQPNHLRGDPSERYSGGGGDGMIERIVRLEEMSKHVQTDVAGLRADMKDVRERLKGLEVKVDHLPSKGFIVSTLLTSLTLFAAVLLFQAKLQALFGIMP